MTMLTLAVIFSSVGFEAIGADILCTVHKNRYNTKQTSLVRVKTPAAATVSAAAASRVRAAVLVADSATKRRPANYSRLASSSSLRRKLSSRSAIVIDNNSGKVLYSHSPDRTGQPASTIKVLTGLLAIKALKEEEKVKVSRRASGMPRSKIYLKPGKNYKADDLIDAVLLASANDAGSALAEQIAGSEKRFASLMTNKARELGASQTVCKTATGLTKRGQTTTVRDLALIFSKAMDDPDFARRISRKRAKTSYGQALRNHNRALWRIKGAVGGKTGYTRAARQTYVGKFRRDCGELVVAIMGSETMWDDISRLVEHGFRKQKQLLAASAPKLAKKKQHTLAQLPLPASRKLPAILVEAKKTPHI